MHRPRRQPQVEFGGRVMLERINYYMSLNQKPHPPIKIQNVKSDPRGAGNCAFASRDIRKGEVICEYEGEVISLQEATQREKIYENEGKPCTLMVLDAGGRQIAIDPYRGSSDGILTWGATLNHSRDNSNVKPFMVDTRHSSNPRVFFVATHDIAETTELLWNYNDADWQFHANSQTLL
ncbi:hypothetical protein ACROYT_G014882 [Oculina patagonica]